MKECLEGLVGLSRTDCSCFDELDADLKKSKLGLFVDELEGIDLTLIQNALNCGAKLGDNFDSLYENAVNFFEIDLQVEFSKNFQQKYRPFAGKLGETKYTGVIETSSLVGIKLDTQFAEGASIIIEDVNLFFNNTGSLTLSLYKNDEKVEDYTITIDSTKVNHKFETPLNLPIVENGIKNDYYFVYNPDGLIPMNNKASCGCAGIESVRKHYLTVKGFKGTSIENYSTDAYTYGLSFNAIISCSLDSLLCEFMNVDVFKRMTGQALWYKLGILTIEELFASRQINFDTFSDREYLYGRKNKFTKNYNNIIAWLSENTTIYQSNCFVCNSNKKVTVGKNLI